MILVVFFFFFQAEDGIRDLYVTGVQTCALPIWSARVVYRPSPRDRAILVPAEAYSSDRRSEERRVGKSVDLGGCRIIKKKKKKKKRNGKEVITEKIIDQYKQRRIGPM